MNKIILKTFISTSFALGAVLIASSAFADQVTGNLSTGISATNGSGVTGVVVSPPIANPPAGIYASAQSVTLSASDATSIRYTVDGTSPTCSTGNLYSGAINVSTSEPIEAISCYSGNASSTVASYLYGINPGGGTQTTSSTGGGGGSSSSSGGSSSSGSFGIADFILLMANWGQPGPGNPADWSGDATVGIPDFIWLMAHWNQ